MKKNKIYTLLHASIKTEQKIHFVHAKQGLRAISVTHAKQFSEHTDSFEYRSRQAVIHTQKHELLTRSKMARGNMKWAPILTADKPPWNIYITLRHKLLYFIPYYRVAQKIWHTFCTANNFNKYWQFSNFFTIRIRRKFVTILSLKIPHTSNLSLHYLVNVSVLKQQLKTRWVL